MATAPTRSLAMILIEPGGQWPRQVSRANVDVVAIAAAREEPDAALVQRARQRIERTSTGLRLVVVACNGDTDDQAMSRRWTWARALLSAILQAGNARLVLSVGAGATTELIRQVRALTSSLREAAKQSASRVSMRLEAGPTVEPAPASSRRGAGRKARWPLLAQGA